MSTAVTVTLVTSIAAATGTVTTDATAAPSVTVAPPFFKLNVPFTVASAPAAKPPAGKSVAVNSTDQPVLSVTSPEALIAATAAVSIAAIIVASSFASAAVNSSVVTVASAAFAAAISSVLAGNVTVTVASPNFVSSNVDVAFTVTDLTVESVATVKEGLAPVVSNLYVVSPAATSSPASSTATAVQFTVSAALPVTTTAASNVTAVSPSAKMLSEDAVTVTDVTPSTSPLPSPTATFALPDFVLSTVDVAVAVNSSPSTAPSGIVNVNIPVVSSTV